MKTFQEFLSESTSNAPISIKKSEHSWGTLILVEKGIDYRAVLHPEHQEMILSLADGETKKFEDEQGIKWNATRNGEDITLKADYRILTFKRSEIE
jgi:hypothetical protein